jgi:NTP pyrophosphatase (non-canonical NTP hydrolase)
MPKILTTHCFLQDLVASIHQNAVNKGFHPKGQSKHTFIEQTSNNMHDEISEFHEAWRNGNFDEPCDKAGKMREVGLDALTCAEEELADIVIRAFDTSKRLKIDIVYAILTKHAFNQTRPHKHGNKRS